MRAALQPWRAGTLLFLLLCLPFPSFPRDVPSESLCLENYATNFLHAYGPSDGTLAGQVWSWSLGALCKPNGTYSYSGAGTSGQTLYFNILGNTSQTCSDYASREPMYASWGVAIQYFQAARGVRNNSAESCLREGNAGACPDYTHIGETTCCSTRRCEVIALEAFRFSLVDMANPASGGVVLDHMGMPASPNDYERCPKENGLERLREFRLTLLCDPSASALEVVQYNENTYCRFYVAAKTKLACGTLVGSASASASFSASPSQPPSLSRTASPVSPQPPAGAAAAAAPPSNAVGPGGQVGFTVLGACLCLLVQYALTVGRPYLPSWAGSGEQRPLPMLIRRSQGVAVPLSAGGVGGKWAVTDASERRSLL